MRKKAKTPRAKKARSAAERRKLALMRQADRASSSRTNIAGAKKVRGPKQKPVTLPDADELRKFWIGDEE
jgi:hypothetical protein